MLVSVIGSVIAGMSAYGISVGARSYLSHKLVTDGATLASFEQLFAIGQVGLVRKFSLGGLLPLLMFALASSSRSVRSTRSLCSGADLQSPALPLWVYSLPQQSTKCSISRSTTSVTRKISTSTRTMRVSVR